MDTDNKVFFGGDDDWDDIDFSDLEEVTDDQTEPSDGTEETGNEDAATEPEEENTAETPEANPAEEVAEDGAEEPEQTEPVSGTDQFTLRVLGEDRTLSRDEMIAAAQKGLDYDRIKGQYSDLQKEREANAPAIELVKELADAQGIPVDQLITNVRAAALARKEGIPIETATERVKLKAREDAVAKRENVFKAQDDADKQEAAAREARNKQFVAFFQKHPSVKPDEIPKQCFRDMADGIPLEYSYAKQMAAQKEQESTKNLSEKEKRIKELEAKIAELDKKSTSKNQNQINAARSVGSADTAGKQSKQDAWDADWYNGT